MIGIGLQILFCTLCVLAYGGTIINKLNRIEKLLLQSKTKEKLK